MHHFSFVLSIDSADPDQVLADILDEVIQAIREGQFRDSYLETDHSGSWRFWEADSVRAPNPETPN